VTIRFLVDENVDPALVEGLRSREARIDILDVKEGGLRGAADSVLLELACEQGRVVVSHDRRTMTRQFYERLNAGTPSPGLFLIRRRAELGSVIDALLLIWGASTAEEYRNLVHYIP
jgi:predicted nuclease of predicted toxin-antitoxin system